VSRPPPEPPLAKASPAPRSRLLTLYFGTVVANYLVQVPYTLHLYGLSFNRTGAFLLGATLAWFIAAALRFRSGRRSGLWLLVAYALVQLVFYVDSEIVMAFVGYGLPYHLGHTGDPIVWMAFAIGDLNFIGAAAAVAVLLRGRRASG
jgi:hypothetical protein